MQDHQFKFTGIFVPIITAYMDPNTSIDFKIDFLLPTNELAR